MISVGGVPLPGDPTSAVDTAAVDARVAAILGAALGVSLTMREACVVALTNASLASNVFEGDPIVYSAGTLTMPVNGDINELAEAEWEVGDRFLWRFTDSDGERGGVYTLTDLGDAGSPAVWTRAADFDESGDFTAGAAVLARDVESGAVGLFRLDVGGGFALDRLRLTFELTDQLTKLVAFLRDADLGFLGRHLGQLTGGGLLLRDLLVGLVLGVFRVADGVGDLRAAQVHQVVGFVFDALYLQRVELQAHLAEHLV